MSERRGKDRRTDRSTRSSMRRKCGRLGDAVGPRGVSRTNSYADHRQRCGRQSDHDGNDQVVEPRSDAEPKIAFTPNRPMEAVMRGGARLFCTALSADGTSALQWRRGPLNSWPASSLLRTGTGADRHRHWSHCLKRDHERNRHRVLTT